MCPRSTYPRGLTQDVCFTTAPAHLPADPAAVAQLLEMMDVPGLLAYASDYPHEHGDGVSLLLDRLSEEERRRVLWGNAAALYELRVRREISE